MNQKEYGLCFEKEEKDKNSMSVWRLEDCPAYADTYIEWCFEKRCKEYRNGVHILTEWRDHKKQLVSYLEASVFDFQHYSRHDESHAVSILESIEMILGKERVDRLSIGDLWLLLECAYSHDMGMSLSYDELIYLWEENEEFKEYVQSLVAEGKEEAVAFYKVTDNLLKGKERFSDLEHYLDRNQSLEDDMKNVQESWPVHMERGIQMIVAEFIRKKHPKRLMETIEKLDEKKNPEIPIRLYKVMVEACSLHGEEFEQIFHKLPYCEKGFGNSRIHPQFAATMLRIGDLLDMDNNRFNVRAVEHYGELPAMSMIHLKKHKAITHLAIKTDGIEVEAKSPEVAVCVIVNQWFQMLDIEVQKLICVWNRIVPAELRGCLLTTCKCQIYLETECGCKEFDTRTDSEFQVDKSKMIKLLMGTNIYNCSIDFIREYLQNALDASKMRLWIDIKSGKLHYSDNIRWRENPKELIPFDIGASIYDQYAIEIYVSLDERAHLVTLEIRDKGIGIEKECVNVISKIGLGWRGRKKYQEEFSKMPKWLQPTGGFGIGLQSAFMASDKVEIITRGLKENEGRKIILENPKGKGSITEEVLREAEEGTTVKVVFDYFELIKAHDVADKNLVDDYQKEPYMLEKDTMREQIEKGLLSRAGMESYVIAFLDNYISRYFAGTMIPFKIISQEGRKTIYRKIANKEFPEIRIERSASKEREYEYTAGNKIKIYSKEIFLNGKKFYLFYIPSNGLKAIYIWNSHDCIFSKIEYQKNGPKCICFKNARVNREKMINESYMKFYSIFIDYEGFYAEKILKVHREEFNPEFQYQLSVYELFEVYFQFLKFLNGIDYVGERFDKDLFDLCPQLVQLVYFKIPLDALRKKEIENRAKVLVLGEGEKYTEFQKQLKNWEEIETDIYRMLSGPKKGVAFVKIPKTDEKESALREDNNILFSSAEVENWIKFQQTKALENVSTAEKTDTKKEQLLKELREKGYVIADEDAVRLLLDYSGVEKTYFRFKNEWDADIYAKLEMREPRKLLSEKEFYKKSCEVELSGIRVFEQEHVNRYLLLTVRTVPFLNREDTGTGYLISPIDRGIAQEMEISKVHTNPEVVVEKISYKEFRKGVIGNAYFQVLIDWVYENQMQEGKYTKNEIREEYEKYIRDIYDWKREE